MPYSYDYFKKEFYEHLFDNFKVNINILDVGAGSGSYGRLLKQDFNNIDCLEVWQPYRKEFNLDSIYRSVFIGDIREFNYFLHDYLILGDILEHLSVNDATSLLTEITTNNVYCMVAVPYMMPQGSVGGNEFETHLQEDLTHEVFCDRYPMMNLLFKNDVYGVYVNYNFI